MSSAAIGRRTVSGTWEVLLPSVYRISGVPTSWIQKVKAATLWLPGAVVSHRDAATLLGLLDDRGDPLEISVTRRAEGPDWIRVHQVSELPSRHIVEVEGVPCTDPGLTLLDLGSSVGRKVLDIALDEAIRRSLVTIPHLQGMLVRYGGRGRRGSASLKTALIERRGPARGVGTVLERRLHSLLRRSRLPSPVPQYEIWDGGTLVARVDFAYPDVRLAIEADSARYHSGIADWKRDLRRRNDLTSLRWRVIHLTWEDLRVRPAEVLRVVEECLRTLAG